MAIGIDLATDAGQVIGAISNAKLDFVARYYRNPTSNWPSLSASEAQILSSSGLQIVAVWEGASNESSYFSYLSGVNDSTSAYHQANKIAQPAGSAIYFAVDYDASGSDIVGSINQYFRGVAAGFAAAGGDTPDYVPGVYGSGSVCQGLTQAGLVDYTWLAMSTGWAGYRSFTTWNIKQGRHCQAFPSTTIPIKPPTITVPSKSAPQRKNTPIALQASELASIRLRATTVSSWSLSPRACLGRREARN